MRTFTLNLTQISIILIFCLPFSSMGQGAPIVIWEEDIHDQSIRSVAFSSDGEQVVSGSDYEENLAHIIDAADAEILSSFSDHAYGIQSVDISSDGLYLAVGYIDIDYASFGMTKLYDLTADTLLYEAPGSQVVFSNDAELLITGGGGVTRDVYVHRVSDGERLNTFYNGSGYVNDISVSPDGQRIAVACTDNKAKIWDIQGDSLLWSIAAHDDDVYAVCFSPNGQLLATGAGGWDEPGESGIKVWSMTDRMLLHELDGHGDWIYDLEFSPDGKILLSAGRDGVGEDAVTQLKSWDVLNGTLQYWYDEDFNGGVRDLAYSPDGGAIVYGRGDGYLVKALPPELGAVSAIEKSAEIIQGFHLMQNYPNPFNPETTIRYIVVGAYSNTPQRVELTIHNILGQEIITLVSEEQPAGVYEVRWNAGDVTSGIYFYRLSVGTSTQIRRMILMR